MRWKLFSLFRKKDILKYLENTWNRAYDSRKEGQSTETNTLTISRLQFKGKIDGLNSPTLHNTS
jgi:hypothetical protein